MVKPVDFMWESILRVLEQKGDITTLDQDEVMIVI